MLIRNEGAPLFQSPQYAKGETQQHGFKSDIWALGVTLYLCIVGSPPFTGDNTIELMDSIPTCEESYPKDLISDELRDLLSGMLELDESKRLSISEGGRLPPVDARRAPRRNLHLADRSLNPPRYFPQ